MSTIVTHQFGQSRSTKIWVDDASLRTPPGILAGFNATLTYVGAPLASDWRIELKGDALGGGLFRSVATLPNGLSVNYTHETVASMIFTTYPLVVMFWQVVVIRCAWAVTSPLVPTILIMDAASIDPTTDTVIGVLKRKSTGAGPTFYSHASGTTHNWPYHMLRSERGVQVRTDYDFTGTRFDAAGLSLTATRARSIRLGASRWRFDDQAYDSLRCQLLAQVQGVATGPGDQVRMIIVATLYRLGQAMVQQDWFDGAVDVSSMSPGTLAAFVDVTPSLSTLLPSSDDWDPETGSDILQINVQRTPAHPDDNYAGNVDVNVVAVDLCTLKPGTAL